MVFVSPLQELSALLWREREILDLLLSGLRSGAPAEECGGMLRAISSLELHRAITAREIAADHGIDGEMTLVDLIAAAPDEWTDVLTNHLEALRGLTGAVRDELDGIVVDLRHPERPRAETRGVQRSLTDFLAS